MFGHKSTSSSNKQKHPRQNIKINQYKIESTIGQGTYGKVKLATHIATNEQVAIKFVEKNRLIRVNDTERIQLEMKIISELNHPNILKAFEIFEDETYFYIVMERPTKGDLFNYICKKKRLTLAEATYMFYQIVNGIDYLHRKGIVHRDMKPENIMITEDMIIKIGDFGLSRFYKSADIKLETTCGSPCYSAPEMLRGNKYYPKPIDVWGLGIMLYVMVCGELPFDGDAEDVLYRKVVQCEYTFPHYCNNNVKNLIKRIFTPNPAERCTIEDVKRSPIYNTGKANFIKTFRIYADDGDVLPLVKEYIKNKSFKSLQEECSMEINKNTESLTAYKIFFYKYLHKTPWNEFYIPSRLDQPKEVPQKTEKTLKSDDEDTNTNQKFKSKKQTKKNYNSNKVNLIDSLLQIPEHDMIGSSPAMTNNIPKTKNDNKELIDGLSKLGVITHSFDKNGYYLDDDDRNNKYKTGNGYTETKKNNRASSMEQTDKKQTFFQNTVNYTQTQTINQQFLNSIKNYSKDDYERDLKFLARQKYLPSGRRVPFKV